MLLHSLCFSSLHREIASVLNPCGQILSVLHTGSGNLPQACVLASFLPRVPRGPHLHGLCCCSPVAWSPTLSLSWTSSSSHTHGLKLGLWGATPTQGSQGLGAWHRLQLPCLPQARLGDSRSPKFFSPHLPLRRSQGREIETTKGLTHRQSHQAC